MSSTIRWAKVAEATMNDPRWRAILDRDHHADGTFWYSVRTTGVYCRPSCGARVARPENIQFHKTIEDARRAGFRACKRCKPDGPEPSEVSTAMIAKLCRAIEQSEGRPSLAKLAKFSGVSVSHLQRTFKAATGLTPSGYAAAHRSRRIRKTLSQTQSVTDAIYEAGFNSNSRFYERTDDVLGMTPANFRNGGANTTIHFAIGECSLGSILVAKSGRGVCAILIGGDPQQLARDLQDQFPKAEIIGNDRGFEDLVAKVVGLVETPANLIDLPLDIRGTVFQQRVWKALQQIPVGSTASYTEIAKVIGMPKAVRAVAQACGANTIALAIPCHRVIRTDGELSGYRWGVERKRALLDREAKA